MKCPKCGEDTKLWCALDDDSVFCVECGELFQSSPTTAKEVEE